MTPRIPRPIILICGIATVIAMTLSGCTPTPTEPPVRVSKLSDTTKAALTKTKLDESWNAVQGQYPGLKRPELKVVRYVDLQEWPKAKADCLTEAGFPSVVSDDGGVSSSVSGAQASAIAIADFQCESMYPLDPTFDVPLNTSQLRFLYHYFTKTLTPCLERAGYTVPSAPSLASFEDAYDSAKSWTPYSTVSTSDNGNMTWSEVNKLCPQVPTGLYGQ